MPTKKMLAWFNSIQTFTIVSLTIVIVLKFKANSLANYVCKLVSFHPI